MTSSLITVDFVGGLIYWDKKPIARLLDTSPYLSPTQLNLAVQALTIVPREVICPECAQEFEAGERHIEKGEGA